MKIVSTSLLLLGTLIFLLSSSYRMIGALLLFLSVIFYLSKYPKIAISLFVIFSLTLLLLEIPIIQASRTDAPDDVDYLILLGAGVDGTTPSLSLLDRLETACQYLKSHPQCKIIVSGGQGSGEDISEAAAMENYLLLQDISPDRILKEDQAENTYQNLAYSFEIIKKETTTPKIAVVSSEYHLYRAKIIAQKLGYHVYGIAAPTSNFFLKLNYFLRESLAVVKTWLT